MLFVMQRFFFVAKSYRKGRVLKLFRSKFKILELEIHLNSLTITP